MYYYELKFQETKINVGIIWEQRADLPVATNVGKSTIVVNGNVYSEGWLTRHESVNVQKRGNAVCCYAPIEDSWTTLPPLPVKCVGLGVVNGQLVAVGGMATVDGLASNKVYTYDEISKRWKQTIPPMPTSRWFPCCLNLMSALIVAGGRDSYCCTNVVEIFRPDISQWYTTHPLPTACANVSLLAIGNTCHLLGGINIQPFMRITQSNTASIENVFPDTTHIQPTPSVIDATTSSWQPLPDTPAYNPTGTVLAGNLIAVGGFETAEANEGVVSKKEIYVYSPAANSWIYISDLPAPLRDAGVVSLSPNEILVIGGKYDCNDTNSVYKGTLNLKI